jgi:hypothetical protein
MSMRRKWGRWAVLVVVILSTGTAGGFYGYRAWKDLTGVKLAGNCAAAIRRC